MNIDQIRREETIEEISYKDKNIKLSGAYGFGADDFKKAFEIMDQYPLDKFISKEISFKELPKFIMDMASGQTDYPGKVVVRF